jgi:hypothetical protein
MSQELKLDDGIYFEKPLPSDSTPHKYSLDNISYKLGSVFVFDYYYVDSSGKRSKFLIDDKNTEENPLNLTPYEYVSKDAIDKIKLEIDDSPMMSEKMPDYTQSVFSLYYLKKSGFPKDTTCLSFKRKSPKLKDMPCGDEGTGVVDNRMNLWMHPPRSHTFKILQLCPYPFYYLDGSINTWGWNLETGGSYLDPRWTKTKKESITITYEYTRGKDEVIDTPLGKMECKVTNAKGICKPARLNTGLKSYYHSKYGFVRLEYDLINGDKMVIWLEEVKQN